MKGDGEDVTQGHLDKSTLFELRDNLINNWDIHYSNPEYQPCKKLFWWSCALNKQQADLLETLHSSSITQELDGYL
jgi:hypothetical protein